jgi:hypothetical protein
MQGQSKKGTEIFLAKRKRYLGKVRSADKIEMDLQNILLKHRIWMKLHQGWIEYF